MNPVTAAETGPGRPPPRKPGLRDQQAEGETQGDKPQGGGGGVAESAPEVATAGRVLTTHNQTIRSSRGKGEAGR